MGAALEGRFRFYDVFAAIFIRPISSTVRAATSAVQPHYGYCASYLTTSSTIKSERFPKDDGSSFVCASVLILAGLAAFSVAWCLASLGGMARCNLPEFALLRMRFLLARGGPLVFACVRED